MFVGNDCHIYHQSTIKYVCDNSKFQMSCQCRMSNVKGLMDLVGLEPFIPLDLQVDSQFVDRIKMSSRLIENSSAFSRRTISSQTVKLFSFM